MQLGIWRSAVSSRSPAGSGAEPQKKSILVHFSLKIWQPVTAIFILVRKNILVETMYTKIQEGLQQKLEGLELLSPIGGAATDCL